MDPVTEADIVRQLVQFAIDGDLGRVAAGIVVERSSVVRGLLRIGDYEPPSKKNFRTVMQAPATVPCPVG